MLVQITRRLAHGVQIDKVEVRKARPITGDMQMQSSVSEVLGRTTVIASLRNPDPLGPDLIPPLFDATLSWMATNGFVVSGIECSEGRLYSQSWWCRQI